MYKYLELLERTLTVGNRRTNRTGVDTLKLSYGESITFDLSEGFPMLTTKYINFDAVKGELLGFLRGYTNARQFAELGCNFWFKDANENKDWVNSEYRLGENDLGRIYGVQWNAFTGECEDINQLKYLCETIVINPESRRMVVTAWSPEDIQNKTMALPPCHVLFKVDCDPINREMSLSWYQRSCDLFLGVPYNISSYALLLSLLAKLYGYTPKYLTGFLDDIHIYENHINQCKLQLIRNPLKLPNLYLDTGALPLKEYEALREIKPENIYLRNYNHHPAIKAEMNTTK